MEGGKGHLLSNIHLKFKENKKVAVTPIRME